MIIERFRSLLIIYLMFFVLSAYATNTHEHVEEKANVEAQSSSENAGWFKRSVRYLGSFTPTIISSTLLGTANWLLGTKFIRVQTEKTAFSSDNRRLSRYDEIFGIYREIPAQGVDEDLFAVLLENAHEERLEWENGKMSGAIYDGSPEHMKMLADIFFAAAQKDAKLALLFKNDNAALQMAADFYEQANNANPLHGTSFILAVKAMRELGAMFSDLFGAKDAIVSSGAAEALRVGLRALKEKSHSQTINLIGEKNRFNKQVAKSLNLSLTEESEDSAPILFMVNADSIDELEEIALEASQQNREMHLHLSYEMFLKLFLEDSPLKTIFVRHKNISSLSFDTGRLIYSGVAATVFRDANTRFDALEAHIHWKGGMYPGINTAGSIAGVDHILAYLLLLHKGKEKLASLAAGELNQLQGLEHRGREQFSAIHYEKTISEYFDNGEKPEFIRNYDLEEQISDLVLSVFATSKEKFSGRVSSGGTESIRMAMQAYFQTFKNCFPRQTPIFLMTSSAHVAFDRHLSDLDAIIIRVEENNYGTMDESALRNTIAQHGAENIAAIIGSTPSYPFGSYDDIELLSKVALEHNIPFHVDACLGGWILQFIDNPLRLDLADTAFAGISSFSVDLHKYALTQKGISFVAMKSEYAHNMFTIAAPRTKTQMGVALGTLLAIGRKGYEERAQKIAALGQALMVDLQSLDLEIITPHTDNVPHFVVAFRLKDNLRTLTYSLASKMKERGWYLSQVGDYAVHMALTNAHTYNENFLSDFIADLGLVINYLKEDPTIIQGSNAGVYGMAANHNLGALDPGKESTAAVLRNFLKMHAENLITLW